MDVFCRFSSFLPVFCLYLIETCLEYMPAKWPVAFITLIILFRYFDSSITQSRDSSRVSPVRIWILLDPVSNSLVSFCPYPFYLLSFASVDNETAANWLLSREFVGRRRGIRTRDLPTVMARQRHFDHRRRKSRIYSGVVGILSRLNAITQFVKITIF